MGLARGKTRWGTSSVRDENRGKAKANLEPFFAGCLVDWLIGWLNIYFLTMNLRDSGNKKDGTKIQALDLSVSGRRERSEV